MHNYLILSDSDLLALINASDIVAYNETINRYRLLLLAKSFKMLKYDRFYAEKPVRQAFTELWRNRMEIDSSWVLPDYLKAELKKVIIGMIIDSPRYEDYLEDFCNRQQDRNLNTKSQPS